MGRKLGRTVYLDERLVGLLDDERLATVVVEGLALLDELGEGDGGDRWRSRLAVWRLRLRALRLEGLTPDRLRGLARARPRARRLGRP